MSTQQQLEALIKAADTAISAGDFDELMDFYDDDAVLVVRPGLNATGKQQIRRAFLAIAEHFNHKLVVKQGKTVVLEGGDTALVVMETFLEAAGEDGLTTSTIRRATYVFRKGLPGKWLCVIDNSYGTELLES